jgi:hypothetical protein
MEKNNPYQAPNTPGAQADSLRPRRVARIVFVFAAGLFLLGAGLFGYGWHEQSVNRVIGSTSELLCTEGYEDYTAELTRGARAVYLACYVGLPAMIVGGVSMLAIRAGLCLTGKYR